MEKRQNFVYIDTKFDIGLSRTILRPVIILSAYSYLLTIFFEWVPLLRLWWAHPNASEALVFSLFHTRDTVTAVVNNARCCCCLETRTLLNPICVHLHVFCLRLVAVWAGASTFFAVKTSRTFRAAASPSFAVRSGRASFAVHAMASWLELARRTFSLLCYTGLLGRREQWVPDLDLQKNTELLERALPVKGPDSTPYHCLASAEYYCHFCQILRKCYRIQQYKV